MKWLRAGLYAGALLGAADVLGALARGVGGLGAVRALQLLLLGASWMGLAGVLAGALVAGGAFLTNRAGPWRGLAAGVLVALVASPVVLWDAFAAFHGHRAASIKGHGKLSAAIIVVSLAALFELARRYDRLLVRLEDAPATPGTAGASGAGRPVWRARVLAGLLLAVAAVGAGANLMVLRRLYPWFHWTLALTCGVSAMLAIRLLAATPVRSSGPVSPRWRRRRLAEFGVVVVLAIYAGKAARGSQSIRFAAFDRTVAVAEMLLLSPVRLHPRTAAAIARAEAQSELPPLPEGPRRPNSDVVLITIDALRADHLGVFGYRRHPTTPNIDRLAMSSVRFARAYAQAPHTSFSVASMLTGKYYPTLARLAPARADDSISSVLRQYGWRTAAFYPPAVFFVDAEKLKAYQETNFDFEYVKFEYIDAQRRVDQVIDYFDKEKPKHAFVWVHFFEPHEPYVAQPEFPFGSGDMDRYDSEIAYTDKAVGRLVAYLRDKRPGASIILAADHGEEFDEHGGRYHGSTLYEEQIHVPLIVSIDGVAPRVIDHPVELIDITPTVLNLADIPVPVRVRGTDLGPWMAKKPADPARLPPAFAEVEDKRAVVLGQEKLICDLNWGFCAYHDLRVDPHERTNAADDHPDRAAALRQVLDEWLDQHVKFEPTLARGKANPNGGEVPKAIERGRLGDLSAAPGLLELVLSTDAKLPVRREAAQLLVALPPRREMAATLALAEKDADRDVADWAAVAAVRAGDKNVDRLHAVLEDDARGRDVRIQAALALGRVNDPAGVPVLAEALDHCDNAVKLCRYIILQLGSLRDRRAVDELLKHLPEVQNRREMVDALGDIGDPRAVPALTERLSSDEYVTVRAQAARALAKIGRPDALPALRKAAASDTEEDVVEAAKEAIGTLKAGRAL